VAREVKVIGRTQEAPCMPYVTPATIGPTGVALLRRALAAAMTDPATAAARKDLLLEGLAFPSNSELVKINDVDEFNRGNLAIKDNILNVDKELTKDNKFFLAIKANGSDKSSVAEEVNVTRESNKDNVAKKKIVVKKSTVSYVTDMSSMSNLSDMIDIANMKKTVKKPNVDGMCTVAKSVYSPMIERFLSEVQGNGHDLNNKIITNEGELKHYRIKLIK